MKKFYKLIMINLFLVLGLNESLLSKEYMVSPSVGSYNELKTIKKPPTIDGKVLFTPISLEQSVVLNSNRLLIQKALNELSLQSRLSQSELDAVDEEFKAISKLIDEMDISKKVVTLTKDLLILDAKLLFDFIWDEVSKVLKNKYGNNFKDGTIQKFILDSSAQIIKVSIDIALEHYNVNTALFSFLLEKEITNGFGKLTALYDGVISTTRLINALNGIVDLSSIQREQYKNTLAFDFIYDYVTFYGGDIQKMKIDIEKEFNPNYTIDSFWSIWYYYMKNRSKIRNSSLSETNIGEQPSLIRLQVLAEAARQSLNLIEKYGNGGVFQGRLKEYFFIDGNSVEKSFVPSVSGDEKYLYFMPQTPITKIGPDMNVGYGILKGNYHRNYLKLLIYFSAPSLEVLDDITDLNKSNYYKLIDDSTEYKNVRKVTNAYFKMVAVSTQQIENLEERRIYVNEFYLPSFFDDKNMGSNYWAMKYIAELFNKGIVKGYSDGNFGPKREISIGEFLLIATKALLYDKYKTQLLTYKKVDDITFSNYAEFLHDYLKIDIDYDLIKNYSSGSLNNNASRAYIAKVLSSILTYSQEKITYSKLDGDWDTYSNFLRQKCIVQGKEDENNIGQFNFSPNDYITRDEISVMIVKSMKYLQGSLNKNNCNNRNY